MSELKIVDGGICAVKGVKAWGTKEGGHGLAFIAGEGNAAAVFTKNKIKAASVQVTREHISSGKLSAIIVNSGNANAFTGTEGLENAKTMAKMAATALNIDSASVAVASTGIIGHQLDMGEIQNQFKSIAGKLDASKEASEHAANSILTTDLSKKEISIEVGKIHIGAIAKGAGMIEPNMGTMLAFIYTDAVLPQETLKRCLKQSTDKSFNMVVVDGDTSTNDMAILVATGACGAVGEAEFQSGLDFICTELAKMMAIDGEGATKLITAKVAGAKSDDDAKRAAKAIVRSNLVKCAVFGEDPNWGRIIAALGRSCAEIDPTKITLKIGDGEKEITFVEGGEAVLSASAEESKEIMAGKDVIIFLNLDIGTYEAVAWGCDLTYDYIKLNSNYLT